MLHNLLIISGRGGIVLFRKSLTKSLNQARLVAGLLSALCKKATESIGLPVSYMELEHFAITVVEDSAPQEAEYLRCVAFHDVEDVGVFFFYTSPPYSDNGVSVSRASYTGGSSDWRYYAHSGHSFRNNSPLRCLGAQTALRRCLKALGRVFVPQLTAPHALCCDIYSVRWVCALRCWCVRVWCSPHIIRVTRRSSPICKVSCTLPMIYWQRVTPRLPSLPSDRIFASIDSRLPLLSSSRSLRQRWLAHLLRQLNRKTICSPLSTVRRRSKKPLTFSSVVSMRACLRLLFLRC